MKKNKVQNKKKNVIETILVMIAILVIPLLFAVNSRATNSSTPQDEAVENILPTTSNSVEPAETTNTAQQPPACTFPLAQTITEESIPEEYTFSEPEITYPYLDERETNVDIIGWLPDNKKVMVVQNYNFNQQTIELFFPETGERQIYAIREQTEQHPVWNQELESIIYPVRHVNSVVNYIPQFSRQAWISSGDPSNIQILQNELSQFYIPINPNNNETIYFLDEQIIKKNGTLEDTQTIPFNLSQWNYNNLKSGVFPLTYKMAWRPNASQIFLYSFADIEHGYTFLIDINSGEICELSMGGWAVVARWSPNGRYLAIERSQSPEAPVAPADLTILDTVTGDLHTLEVVPQELEGIRTVSGLAWGPDNHHLLILGSNLSFPQCGENCFYNTNLYLVDFLSRQVNIVLPDQHFTVNYSDSNLAWSSDGSKVLALCPTLCNISVQISEQ